MADINKQQGTNKQQSSSMGGQNKNDRTSSSKDNVPQQRGNPQQPNVNKQR